MNESEMDNRGSKSITCFNMPASQKKAVIVKEQRVDGSYIGFLCILNKYPMLRCILMRFERRCPKGISILVVAVVAVAAAAAAATVT